MNLRWIKLVLEWIWDKQLQFLKEWINVNMPCISHYSLFPDLAGAHRGIRIRTPYWFVCFVVSSSQLLSLLLEVLSFSSCKPIQFVMHEWLSTIKAIRSRDRFMPARKLSCTVCLLRGLVVVRSFWLLGNGTFTSCSSGTRSWVWVQVYCLLL